MSLVAAALSWFINAGLLFAVFRAGMSRASPALIAATLILMLQTCFRPLLFFFELDTPYPQSYFWQSEWDLVSTANLTVTVWVICLLLGYGTYGSVATILARLLPASLRIRSEQRPRGLVLATLAPLTLAVGGTLYLAAQYGGLFQLIYASKIGKELKGLFVIQEASTLASVLAWYGVISTVRNARVNGTRVGPIVLVYLTFVVLAMAANYFWGNRYNIAILILIFGFSWHFCVHRIRLMKAVFVGVMALTALQVLKYIRIEAVSTVLNTQISYQESFWLDLSTSLHFVEYDALMLALRDTGDMFEFRGGADFINGLVSWIPRSLLPEKETFNIGGWFRQVYEPGILNGWPVTTVGAWYINFGWVGVPLGGIFSGFVLRVFDIAFRKVKSDPWQAVIGFSLVFLMLEGGVNTGFPQRIILLIVPLWLTVVYLTMMRPKAPYLVTSLRGKSPILARQ